MTVLTAMKKGGRPTRAASEELSAKLVATARELFMKQGYAETKIEQVTAACGVGKDTLYRRFASKEELFREIVKDATQRTMAWYDRSMAESPTDPMQKVKHISRWLLDANLDPELLALKREAFIQTMRSKSLISEDPFTPKLISAISEAHNAGQLHAPDPDFAAKQLLAAIVLGPSNDALMGSNALSNMRDRDIWFERAWWFFVEGISAEK
jgi:AcrR family transcriptional regulator